MVVNLYAVHDFKSESYERPFPAVNDAVACRMFVAALRQPDSMLAAHPQDFALYCLGTFDDYNGVISGLDVRRHVVDAASLVEGGL
jgi:hypothetical protein